jgi:hypothetical protein
VTDDEFDAYVSQIIEAAKSGDTADELVGHLLGEFQEKCYLSGRHMLIDSLRRQLDSFDDRPRRT